MTQNHDDIDDIPSLVPERDELVSHRTKAKRGISQPIRTASSNEGPGSTGTSGVVIFFLVLLFLGMCGSAVGGYYFFEQSEQSKAELLTAANRITALEATLNDMDAATKESSLGLLERVDTNFKEIDKLWASRNALKTEVEKLTAAMTAVQKDTKEFETAIGSTANLLNQEKAAITAIQTKIEEINKNFSGMTNLGQQLTTLNADLNRVKTAMNKVESDVNSRLKATEDDIESINVYRLQLNQTMTTLQNNLNALQQKVGN
jgi:chromosome segregation ATPase